MIISQPRCFYKNISTGSNLSCVKSTRFISNIGAVEPFFHPIAVVIRPSCNLVCPLRNPFQSLLSKRETNTIRIHTLYTIDLPITTSNTSLFSSSLFIPQTIFSKLVKPVGLLQSPQLTQLLHSPLFMQSLQHPVFTISHSIQTLPDPIISFGSSLLFWCETEQHITLPDWISLSNPDKENKISIYTLCSVVVKELNHFITFKRLFTPAQSKSEGSELLYDLKTWSQWVQLKEGGCYFVSPEFLKLASPYVLHYEKVLF